MTAEREQARWRRRKDARPSEIVDAALACFADYGFAATRLDQVARRAGISKGTLYLYFSSKEELFKAVVREALLPNIARFESHMGEASPSVLLRAIIVGLPKGILDHPVSIIPKLVISEAGNFPEVARFYIEEVIDRGRSLLSGLLRQGVEKGEFRNDIDVDHVVYCVIAPVLLVALWKRSLDPHDPRGPLDADAVLEAHADLVLHGLSFSRKPLE